MPRQLNLVRGDSSANAIAQAGVKQNDIVTFFDSLSWGPVKRSNSDDLRKNFWASLGVPPSDDYARLEQIIRNNPAASFRIWPESFLDGMLFLFWSITALADMGVSEDDMLVPATATSASFYVGSSSADALRGTTFIPIRQVLGRHEIIFVWEHFVAGDIEKFYSDVLRLHQTGHKWVGRLLDITDRLRSAGTKVPPIVRQMLDIVGEQDEPQPVSRVVGRMLTSRYGGRGMLDTDVPLFALIKELSSAPNRLVEVRATGGVEDEYPIRHVVRLLPAGVDVRNGRAPFPIGSASVLRCIGGHDQVTSSLTFDEERAQFVY